MEQFWYVLAIAGLVFGFGFVVFFHELGHFLAAKWVGIKVEQFAVGFGHAVLAWRKGLGLRIGTTTPEYERRLKAHLSEKGIAAAEPSLQQLRRASDELGISETEYRLNWLPLGGYVKMLGQDDMNPNAQSDDPRSFNRKSIGARMVVVSAGVIMNVILAAILFWALFLYGLHIYPPVVGGMLTNSPAQLSGLQVGDRIVDLDGWEQHDFAKLKLSTALADPTRAIPVMVRRDGQLITKEIRPAKEGEASTEFLALGINQPLELRGLDIAMVSQAQEKTLYGPIDAGKEILPGDTIVAVEGKPVSISDYPVFDAAMQNSEGKPVQLTVRSADGDERMVMVQPVFQAFFSGPIRFAGMEPGAKVFSVEKGAPSEGKLEPGDLIVSVQVDGTMLRHPSVGDVRKLTGEAGQNGGKVLFQVERDGKVIDLPPIEANYRVGKGHWGIGFGPMVSEGRPIVAAVHETSAAAQAQIPTGVLIQTVNGRPVSDWHEVVTEMRAAIASGSSSVPLTYVPLDKQAPAAQAVSTTLELSPEEIQSLQNVRYTHMLALMPSETVRRTSNPLVAAGWGVVETRDLLLQFYVTLHRLTQGSVDATNFMGPLGIVHAGSFFAQKGLDWLIWFLAMISANLAVVNFLPIPIVDGGLFLFLIIEKIKGKPLSARMQTVAQLVGLAIILSVFLLVTYQDIRRIFL